MGARSLFLILAVLATSLLARAAEDDKVMGNYHGSFTSGAMSNGFIRAEVIALGKTAYRANFFIGQDEVTAQRVEVQGQRENEQSPAQLEGQVTLGATGDCAIAAIIVDEKMTGTVTCGGVQSEFALARVFIKSPSLGMTPPEGAIVLMDDTSSSFVRTNEGMCPQGNGMFRVCASNFVSTTEFGPARYHIEFMTPFMPDSRGQGRGNSGVYLLGRYEVQVLDSFGDLPADNLCGGIYRKATPTAMAALPPLQRQTYDITFYPPEFDQSGRKTRDAIITVIHNGVTIHDNVVLDGPTPGGVSDQEAATGPLLLQYHNDAVDFGNIWVQPLNN